MPGITPHAEVGVGHVAGSGSNPWTCGALRKMRSEFTFGHHFVLRFSAASSRRIPSPPSGVLAQHTGWKS